MATQDDTIDIVVRIGTTPIGRQGFGTALIVDSGGTMSERVRYYTSATAVQADALTGAITAAQATAMLSALAQTNKPRRVGAARASFAAPVSQAVTITVGGTATAGDYTITVGGTAYTYTAIPADTSATIGAGLRAALATAPGVTITGATTSVVITATAPGGSYTYSLAAPAPGTLTDTIVVPASSLAQELTAILAARSDWYGLSLVSRDKTLLLQAASWARVARRLHFAQTSDADALAGAPASLPAQIKALGDPFTKALWYSLDAVPYAYTLLTERLSFDLDTRVAPTLAPVRLVGIVADDAAISETQLVNLRAAYAGAYLSLLGVPASDTKKDAQRLGSGITLQERLIGSWVEARLTEDHAQQLLTLAARGLAIPYTDAGFAQVRAVAMARLERGITLGHLERALDDQDRQISPFVSVPVRADLPQEVVASGALAYTCGALLAGSVCEISGVAELTDDLALLELLAAL